jgi:nucleotide-binding universal stress UspA family protein
MHQVLIVANQTLGGSELVDRMGRIGRALGACRAYLVVPAAEATPLVLADPFGFMWTPPAGAAGAGEAQARLRLGLRALRRLGLQVDGEVGPPDPVLAARAVVARDERIDHVVLTTVPHGPSRWLRLDAGSRLARALRRPIEQIVASADADTDLLAAV